MSFSYSGKWLVLERNILLFCRIYFVVKVAFGRVDDHGVVAFAVVVAHVDVAGRKSPKYICNIFADIVIKHFQGKVSNFPSSNGQTLFYESCGVWCSIMAGQFNANFEMS